MKNERLDFVRNSMVWSGPHSEISSPLTDRQRNGTAVPSLASEYLQEAASAGAPTGVRQKVLDAPLVLHVARHALRDLYRRSLREAPRCRRVSRM